MNQDLFIRLHRTQGQSLSQKLIEYRQIEKTHRGRQGKKLEDALCKVLRSFLPDRYGIVTGRVVDMHGNFSRQSDLIVFDQLFNAKLVYEDQQDQYVPIEAVRCVIEVKSKLTKQSLQDSITNLASLRRLARVYRQLMNGVLYGPNTLIPPINYYLFAFDSRVSNTDKLIELAESAIVNLRRQYPKNYLAYFPNQICINSLGCINFMQRSTKPGHQNESYYNPIITTYGKDELLIGFSECKDDALFFFLTRLLEEADSVPPVKSAFPHALFISNTQQVKVSEEKHSFITPPI